jgi:hypothetical protein
MFELVHTNLATLSLLVLVLCLIFELPQNLLSLLSPDSTKVVRLLLKAHEITRMPTHLSHHVDNLSNTTGAFNPKFYTSGPNVDIVWENSNISSSVILFKRSIDGGDVFGPEILLSKYEQHSVHPQIIGSGSNLYVVWQHSNLAIVLIKSTDNGATFGPTKKVVDTTAYAQDLQVAATGDNVYILWRDGSTESIFLKSSIDGGLTFGPAIDLTNHSSSVFNPYIYATDTMLYIAWMEKGINSQGSIVLTKMSIPNGLSSPKTTTLTNTTDVQSECCPRIAAAGKNVYLLWEDDSIRHKSFIAMKKSGDTGATFGPTINLSNNISKATFGISYDPELTVFGNNLYVKFQDVNAGILLKKSTDGGLNFGPPIRFSDTTAVSDMQIAAVSNSLMYALWKNTTTGNNNIFFKRVISSENIFSPATKLSNNPDGEPVSGPVLSAYANSLYILWENLNSGNYTILLRKSTDNGATFGPTKKVVDTTAYAQDLQVAATGDNVYILWRDGSTESIFLKSSIDGGLTFGPAVKLSNTTAAAASELKIAAAGSNVYVLWKDLSLHNHYSILLRESMDTGISFGPAVKLSNTTAASDLKIAAAGSNVYVLWTDMLSGNFNILLKRISNNGAIYAHPTVLATNGFDPDLSASGNSVYVVWNYVNNYNDDSCGAIVTDKTEKDNIQGRGGGIYLVRSNDSGTVFGPPLKLSNSSAASELEITADGPNIYTLWKEDNMVLRSSADNGTTFGPEIDMNKYYGSSSTLSNAMNFKLTSSASPEYKDNINSNSKSVYLTWNQQPIMSTLDYGRTQSDVFFGMIQLLEYESQVDYNASVYYHQPKCPDIQQTASAVDAGSGEQLLSVVQIRPPLQEAVWLYTYYWHDQLTHSLVDNLLARKINTIYFSAPQVGGWDNSSRVSDYLNFINYAKTKGMQVYGVTLEDPSFVFMTQAQLTNIFGSFINKTASVFDTYVIDVEPQAMAGADLHVYLPRYVTMSGILRNIADQFHKQIIDTVPTWYNMALKQIGISIGLNALSSNRINLIDYTYGSQSILNNISDLRTDLSTPYIVNLMITPGQGAPQLSGQEIKQTIITLKANLLPLALDDAHYIMRLNSSLFQ